MDRRRFLKTQRLLTVGSTLGAGQFVAALLCCALGGAPLALAGEGRLTKGRFRSEALGETRPYSVYLPPGYDPSCARRYPLLVVLHGLAGTHGEFFHQGGLHGALDRLIGEGKVPPLIAAAPDGGSDYWSNQLPEKGRPAKRFGDYVAFDLVDHLDAHLCTVQKGRARAIAGVSMGGFGALSLALQHPDRFHAAVSLSGALFLTPPTHRKAYAKVWGNPPIPQRWAEVSPLALLERLDRAHPGPLVYLLCGTEDGLGFHEFARAAHRVLSERGIPHGFELRPGHHTWAFWHEVIQEGGWLVWVGGALAE
jgi:S-formylglutathione hydrolase FrmB